MELSPTELDHLPEISLDTPKWSALDQYLEEYYAQLGSQGKGLKTYFDEFDKKLEGLRGIVIMGGEPGSGKTALALQIGFDTAADEANIPVVIYSFEMPKAQLVTRLFQRVGKIRYRTLQQKTTELTEADRQQVQDTQKQIQNIAHRLFIRETKDFFKGAKDGSGSISAVFDFGEQIRHLEQLTQQFGKPPLVIIDSLHEIPVDQQYGRELKQKIDHLMLNLRNMCDQTGATILLISHQSRSGQSSGGLQSFMGSASIEYTVDMALTITNPTQEDSPEKERELSVAKNRYGPKPKARLYFDGAFMDFEFVELISSLGVAMPEKAPKKASKKKDDSI
ncbi:DnaB-like helicase C-terminal domain-containing protein [Spirosoma sp. 48-14]|uniref:DnaB-like helicase C-terminal domain-containing protein n=1 Tax=Spirosoma sp. 48-14 TaxID=1895854 RepID=UPI0009633506|nr:DnaB-like helicase C-terminal domain-containing protein [Spirosoma sp. 48-14]OJW75398.1 MAG: hypothetical protein BGO59_19925 [Spirosoma sp. 48-14]